MDIDKLFTNRNKSFARLCEAGDYLGRRLRENLTIYDIDDSTSKVTYISEKNNLISCTYKETKGKLTLESFEVEDIDSITSDEAIDSKVSSSVQQFLESIHKDRYDSAEFSFDGILKSFVMRAKIDESRKKLHKRLERFNDSYNITETKAYRKFEESLPMFTKFLEENKEALQGNKKLVEGLRLCKVVGETYDLPKLTLENLEEEFVIVPKNSKKTLYEMVCEKELIRKELMEARESFSRMWAKNDSIGNLASHIYSTDSAIKESLKEAITEIPYMALSNKVTLSTVMESVFQVTNPGAISQKDIREFVSKLYEYKKPLKRLVIDTLNEKYGVNIQSLKFVPSFKGLADVHGQVFSILSEEAGEGILSDVLKEFSECIARKGGVQVIDIANTLSDVMKEAEFDIVDINEDFQMKTLAEYLQEALNDAQYYGDDDELSNDPGIGTRKKYGGNKGDKSKTKKGKKDYKDDDDEDDDPKNKNSKKLRKEAHEEEDEDEEYIEGEEVEKEEEEDETEEDPGVEAADADARKADFRDLVKQIDSLTKDIDMSFDEDEDLEAEEEAEEDEEGEEDLKKKEEEEEVGDEPTQ